MEISAMRMNFIVLGLSLCFVLLSFHEVSSQDDSTTSRLSNLDLIEREYQDSVNALQGKEDEAQSAKIQSENQKNTTVTDKNTISLSLSDESDNTLTDSVEKSTKPEAVSDKSINRSSLLDQIELEFEAHLNGLNQAGSDGVKAESKDDEELSAQRKNILEEIERDFEAASTSLKQLKIDEVSQGNDEEQSAKRQSLLEEIEREFEAATKDLEQLKVNDFTGDNNDDEELSAKRKSMLEAIEREFEAAIEGLEELKVSDSTGSKDDEEQSAKRLGMLEEIEREFEAATKGLEQLKVNDLTSEDKIEEEQQIAKRQSMLEEIERDFQAATDSLKQLQAETSTEDKEQTAKRQTMLEEIEREFEAATSGLKQLNDLTEGNADDEQSEKRNRMLEEMEREFEAATKGLEKLNVNDFTEGSDNEEQSAKRKSMLEEIEREFEAAIGSLKQIKDDDSKNIAEQSAKRKIMLEEIEREFEEAQSGLSEKTNKEEPTKKQSGSITPEFLGQGQSGACGCFNQDSASLKQEDDASISIPTKYSIDEILSEESAIEGTETSSSLTKSLTQLVENHRKEKESYNAQRVFTSSPSTSESAATSETVDSLRAKLKELRGLTARQLVTRPDFEKILVMAASFEELSAAPISYISRLAKYGNVIKEGLEASERVHIAKARAKMLKETAKEKQTFVDANFAAAKTLAQKGDELYVRIFTIKKLLKKLEAERETVDGKFKEIVNSLSHLLVDASEAYEEYHEAVRKAKDEQAAEEFAKEATESAEIIWVKFLSSL